MDEVPCMGLSAQNLMLQQRQSNCFLAAQEVLDRKGGPTSSLPYEVLRQTLACMEPSDLSELLCA